MIGARLRELRESRGLSLRSLAGDTGLSAALLSQIENGRTDPSIATVRKLAEVFDSDVAELFREPSAPLVHLSRPGDRTVLRGPHHEVDYERLTPGRGDLEVLRAVLPPGSATAAAPRSHVSTECVYVLSGEIVAEVGGEHYRVQQAESLTFDSRLAHRYVNTSAAAATVLISVTPPTP
ncbi:helix-turn-helix domain-containing protein [Miniimonas sp. S16]|uniref:helix-turn-helix domain-containing protein n=1 Tax=Miniimonas sp. S16 TaxID=2171623 RepID=UPI000D526C4A|nr:helix-turn-helix domain-containing protein [Miniimonas sp. S16]